LLLLISPPAGICVVAAGKAVEISRTIEWVGFPTSTLELGLFSALSTYIYTCFFVLEDSVAEWGEEETLMVAVKGCGGGSLKSARK
jgi:hypothetical protein